MNIKNSVSNYTRHKNLNWYGHLQKNNEERLPGTILKWCPPGGRRRKGRYRNSQMQEVITGMRGQGINNLDWIDRGEWKSKINLQSSQKDVQATIIFKYI